MFLADQLTFPLSGGSQVKIEKWLTGVDVTYVRNIFSIPQYFRPLLALHQVTCLRQVTQATSATNWMFSKPLV